MKRIPYWIFFCFLFAFKVVETTQHPNVTLHVPMRDGKELLTDLYYPKDAVIGDDYPCILLRLPAGRSADPWRQLSAMANYGYVVAIQDTRSSIDPEGKTVPYISDGWGEIHQDGYDTVEYLSNSSFTNGKIGTLGFSAAGVTQVMLAPTNPPHLQCQYIGQAATNLYHQAIYPGGQLHKNQVEMWLGMYAPDISVMSTILANPLYNDFWENFNANARAHQVNVPALHYGGWYDPFLKGTIEGFVYRQEHGQHGARGNQRLLIGPWGHFWPQDLSLGEFEVPDIAKAPPIDLSEKRYFDFYLKGVDNGLEKDPLVTYYVMGPFDGSDSSGNVWRYSDQWPVPFAEETLYLSEDRQLVVESEKKSSVLKYHSDPENPVPTIGGRNLFLAFGPRDQREIEKRDDVLVFTSEPLNEDWEVTGKIHVKVFHESNTEDADVAVRLTDVYPDGKSILITDGICRTASFGMEFSGLNEYTVDLCSTSIVFAKGHRIRIAIAGSNYPRYEKNLHVGSNKSEPHAIAQNQIHVGEKTPSRLLLPVVRKGDVWLVPRDVK